MLTELRAHLARATPGDRLPSVRHWVSELRVSPVTVSRALAQLRDEGLVDPRPGAGTFVARRPERPRVDHAWQSLVLGSAPDVGDALHDNVAEPAAGMLPLASGYPDPTLQPTAELAKVAARVMRTGRAWTRAPVEGLPELRAWFARGIGPELDPDDVLIVPGGQAGITTTLAALTRPGQPLLVESPTYLGAISAARALGLQLVPVPCDEHGLRVDLLADAFETSGARVLYVQPTFANPTGATLSPERRAAVLALARKHGAFVVEDDYARDLAYDGRPPPCLASEDDGHVVHLRSLTKSTTPSVRVAALAARGPVMYRLRARRVVEDFFVSRALQEVALELVTARAFERHLARLREGLAERTHVLVAALGHHLPDARIVHVPRGGFSLLVELPVDDRLAVRLAGEVGVTTSPGRHWFPAEPPGSFLRLAVAAAPVPALQEGVRRLAKALRAELRAR